jgi:redox-sensitive bicupin YhaK (pirin superfamily)
VFYTKNFIPEFAHQGGLFEMVQLWVNLPAHSKMTPAKYQAIEATISKAFT